jgi:hypothetical protein
LTLEQSVPDVIGKETFQRDGERGTTDEVGGCQEIPGDISSSCRGEGRHGAKLDDKASANEVRAQRKCNMT